MPSKIPPPQWCSKCRILDGRDDLQASTMDFAICSKEQGHYPFNRFTRTLSGKNSIAPRVAINKFIGHTTRISLMTRILSLQIVKMTLDRSCVLYSVACWILAAFRYG